MSRRTRDERGFTSIELILAVTVLGIIIVPIAAAMFVILTNSTSTQKRLATSHDIQITDAYLGSDIESSGSGLLDPVAAALVRAPVTKVAPTWGAGCFTAPAGTITPVVTLTWRDSDVPSPPGIADHWAYYYVARTTTAGSRGTLHRATCAKLVGSGAVLARSDTIVAHEIAPTAPVLSCDALLTCAATGPRTVSVKLWLDPAQEVNLQATRRVV